MRRTDGFSVRFTAGARLDLRAIHLYITENDSREKADRVTSGIVQAALTLQGTPSRGAHPAELSHTGNSSYREIFFKPYRIVYRIRSRTVFIALIADGRRDMAPLLSRRLSGT
jgi:toxin ParE1/3/4